MNTCRECGKDILDDKELCDNCAEAESTPNDDETYLDELLGSIALNEEEQSDFFSEDKEEVAGNEEEDVDELLGNILNNLDEFDFDKEAFNSMEEDYNGEDSSSENTEGDILDLLSILEGVNEEESEGLEEYYNEAKPEPAEDIFSLDDLLLDQEEESLDQEEESLDQEDTYSMGANMGDVFSDTLGVVSSSPNQEEIQENELLNMVTGNKQENEKKEGFFSKIFSHKKEEMKSDVGEEEEQTFDNSKKTKKTNKTKKSKKTNKDENVINPSQEEEVLKDKKKSVTKTKKTKKKKEKKFKSVVTPKQEIIEIETEKINKVAAVIIFLGLSGVTLFLIFSMNILNYGQSMDRAEKYFEEKNYTQAYQEVAGLKVKAGDEKAYKKIKTVMYVNKQLDSYNNYSFMGKYPEALDSLLKGLKRYDEYIVEAKNIGVKSDLDYVKEQILEELELFFEISEEEAYDILEMKSQEEYSKCVIQLAEDIDRRRNDSNN